MITFSRTAAAFALVMSISGAASAQVDPAAKQAVEAMKSAMQSATDLSFKSKRTATGLLKDFINLEGEVKIVREAGKPTTSHTNLKAKMPGAPDKVVDLWTDGANAMWNDATNNTQFIRPVKDPQAVSEINMTKQIMFEEWNDPKAFDREMNAESLKIDGVENVKGKVCDKIVATFAGGRSSIWYVDAVDHLPLKREDVATGNANQPSLTIITEMWDFQKNAGVKASTIALALPQGYQVNRKEEAKPIVDNIPAPSDIGPKVGEAAAAFELKNTQGKDVTLASLKGHVVLMSFFGTWNAPSMRAATEIQGIFTDYKDRGVKVLGLACSEPDAAAAKKAIDGAKFEYDILMDCDSVATQYLVQGVPSYCIIDKEGKVANFFQAYPGKDKLTQAIDALLK